MTIGTKIKARRLELGISQADLAKKVGISQATLSEIENNITEWPRSNSIAAFADALKVTTDYLLRDEAPEPA